MISRAPLSLCCRAASSELSRCSRTPAGLQEFWPPRIDHIHDAPDVMPEMPHVEIPSAVHLLDRHLEAAFAVLKAAISDGLHIVCFPPRWDRICRAARRETRRGKHNGGYCSALERFHRAHLIPPRAAIYRTINDQLTLTD